MCRLSGGCSTSKRVTDFVTLSLRSVITQWFDVRERISGDASTPGYRNGDGSGLGWFSANADDLIAFVYRRANSARNGPSLSSVAKKAYSVVSLVCIRVALVGINASKLLFIGRDYFNMQHRGGGGFVGVRRRLVAAVQDNYFDLKLAHSSNSTALCHANLFSFVGNSTASFWVQVV